MKKRVIVLFSSLILLNLALSFAIHLQTNSKCGDKELVLSFLNKIIRTDFPRRQINILYHGESPPHVRNRPCKDMEQLLQEDQAGEEGETPLMRSAVTVSWNIFKEEQVLRAKRQNDTFVGDNFHFHQLSHWTEVNLVFLYTLEQLNAMVSSLVFKRINSYNFIVEQEKLVEDLSRPNLLMMPAMNRLKFKISLSWDPESKELVGESTCFYCDEGDPEVVQVWRGSLRGASSSSSSPILPSRSDLFKDYTRDLNGKMLRVSLSLGIPTMMNFKVLKNGRMVATTGFQTSLFHLVRKKLNFSYQLKLEPVFGLEGPNGTYSGMVGAVQTGRADLGMGAAVTAGRHRVVHYLTPNTFHIVTFITRSAILLPEWQTILRAFTRPLWFTLFLVTIFIMLPVYATVSVLGKSGSTSSAGDLSLGAILSNGISFIFRPLMDQHRVLSSNSGIRTLTVFWLFGVLVICAEFRSNLISLFLQPPIESLPTTFTQLANSDYAIYTHYAGGSLGDIVRATHTKTFDKINEKMILEESIQKCLKVTMTQKAACISYEDDAIIEGERYFSDPYGHSFIHRAPFAAFNFFASIILPKEAVHIDVMEETVGQIVDMGITKRFHDEQHRSTKRKGMSLARKRRNKLPIYYDSHHHFAKLNAGHFSAAFAVYCLGVVAAIISWLFEQRETDSLRVLLKNVVHYMHSLPSCLQVGPLKQLNRVRPVSSQVQNTPEGGSDDDSGSNERRRIVVASAARAETFEDPPPALELVSN